MIEQSPSWLIALRRGLRQLFWWPVSQVTAGFHLLPPLASIILFLLLIRSGQLREIYLSYLEHFDALGLADLVQMICAALAFCLLSAALLISHYALSPMQAEILFQGSTGPHGGSSLNLLQKASAFLLSLVPWIGLVAGLYFARNGVADIRGKLGDMMTPLGSIAPDVANKADTMARLQERAWPAMFVVGLMGLGVASGLHRCSHTRYRGVWWQVIIIAIVVVLGVVGFAPLLANDSDTIEFYRALGPLATLALSFLFFFSIAAALAYCSKEVFLLGSGFPAVTLAVLAVGVGVFFGIPTRTMAEWLFAVSVLFVAVAVFLRLEEPVAPLTGLIALMALCTVLREKGLADKIEIAALPPPEKILSEQFSDWMTARTADRLHWSASGRGYPVFIIAVQGGGIYAAAAASAFLGRLQDRCPGFAQHVFAISAVSGGAIAATGFQVLAHSLPLTEGVPCVALSGAEQGRFTKELAGIMLGDHFSPVVASILPDFIGLQWDRAAGLERSFVRSFAAADPATVDTLRSDFPTYWSASSAAPALVLNTTWAETGYRVAFAPFRLTGEGDETSFGFYDNCMLGGAKSTVNLMQAAAISARFPGILPPYAILKDVNDKPTRACPSDANGTKSVSEPNDGKRKEQRWNFVDGGYSDPSGAATALEIYRALGSSHKDFDFDLKLVVLTGAASGPQFKDINGTSFRDVIAPIDAVLKVREVLAGQAVARVKEYFKDHPESVAYVELQDELFDLPLGWKISEATFDIVSLLVGREDLCIPPSRLKQPSPASEILQRNSCAMKAIESALTPPSP